MGLFILFINFKISKMKNNILIIALMLSICSFAQNSTTNKNLDQRIENIIFTELDNIIDNHYHEKESIYSKKMTDSDKKRIKKLHTDFKNNLENKINELSSKYKIEQKGIRSIYANLKSKKGNRNQH